MFPTLDEAVGRGPWAVVRAEMRVVMGMATDWRSAGRTRRTAYPPWLEPSGLPREVEKKKACGEKFREEWFAARRTSTWSGVFGPCTGRGYVDVAPNSALPLRVQCGGKPWRM